MTLDPQIEEIAQRIFRNKDGDPITLDRARELATIAVDAANKAGATFRETLDRELSKASTAPSGQAPLEGVKEAQHAFNLELLANVVEAERWPAIIAPVAARQLREAANALHPLLPASAEPVAEGEYELAETVHGEIVRIVKRHNPLKEPVASPPASGAVEAGWQLSEPDGTVHELDIDQARRAIAAALSPDEQDAELKKLRAQVTLLTEAHSIASEANRSAWQIAERKGENTNWDGHRKQLMGALETSHAALNSILFPAAPTEGE